MTWKGVELRVKSTLDLSQEKGNLRMSDVLFGVLYIDASGYWWKYSEIFPRYNGGLFPVDIGESE